MHSPSYVTTAGSYLGRVRVGVRVGVGVGVRVRVGVGARARVRVKVSLQRVVEVGRRERAAEGRDEPGQG